MSDEHLDRLKEKRMSVHVYYRYEPLNDLGNQDHRPILQGPLRLTFYCFLIFILPCILLITPLYIRYHVFRDAVYHLIESDSIIVDQPISTFWCEGQQLSMNSTFQAFLLANSHEAMLLESGNLIDMERSIHVSFDTLEYFTFFLPQGTKVALSTCSAYEQAKLTIVQGVDSLSRCGLPVVNSQDQLTNATEVDEGELTFEDRDLLVSNKNLELISEKVEQQQEEPNILESYDDGDPTTSPLLSKRINWTCSDDDTIFTSPIIQTYGCINKDLKAIPHNFIIMEIHSSDYYSFIFHSEDALVDNLIHVQFEINPSLQHQFSNETNSCSNKTSCTLPLNFLSSEKVLLRVSMNGDVRNYDELQQLGLVASCIPRLGIYLIFPVCILILVLYCAFV